MIYREDDWEEDYPEDEDYDYDYDGEDEGIQFADPGGNSSLRAASASNPRNLPCPNCEEPNRLTPQDRAAGYQCNSCADQAERGGY